jgi:predicted transposase YbfD/YdcC
MAPLSLLEALADVPDPRSRHGRRHPLLAILALTVLAMLRGCKGPTAIAQFGRDHGVELAHALGFRRGKTPAPSCLCALYRALDADAFEAARARWIAARTPPPPADGDPSPVSLDGKTLRGSRDGDTPGHHLVSAYAHEHQAVLLQIRARPRPTNTRPPCNCWVSCPSRVASSSAMRCSASVTCAARSSNKAALTCSRSRATNWAWRGTSPPASVLRPPRGVSRRLFPPEAVAPAPPPQRVHTSVDKGHGRVEKRTVRTTAILTLHQKWPGLAQGLEITRERTVKGVTTVEMEYAMTSLKPEQADAQRLSELVREHWGMENGLHWVRDVTLGEDGCRVRKGNAPQVLAAVRNAVLHLLAGIVAPNHAAAIRRLNAHPEEALALLDLPQTQ